MVEDSQSDYALVTAALRGAGFRLRHAATAADALEVLGATSISCTLLDLGLPDASGLEALDLVLAAADGAVVVVTALDDELLALEALGRGAQDYLLKHEIRAPLLERSMRYAIERVRNQRLTRRLADMHDVADRAQVALRRAEAGQRLRGTRTVPHRGEVQLAGAVLERCHRRGGRPRPPAVRQPRGPAAPRPGCRDARRPQRLRPGPSRRPPTHRRGVQPHAYAAGGPRAQQVRLRHADGSWRHFEIVGNNLVADAAVGGVVINARDVTERQEAEEQAAAQADILERTARAPRCGRRSASSPSRWSASSPDAGSR